MAPGSISKSMHPGAIASPHRPLGVLEKEAHRAASHVVAVENALRADEPQPSLSQEDALAAAPDAAQGGFRVPSPGAGGGA